MDVVICHNLNSTHLHDTIPGDFITILGVLIIVVTIFGNVVVIHTYRVTPKLQIPLNVLLINLAIADIITAIITIPLWICLYLKAIDVYFDDYPCLISALFGSVAQIPFAVSFFTILIICIVRCLVVIYPIQSRNVWITKYRMKLCSSITWIYTTLFFLLDFTYRTGWFADISANYLRPIAIPAMIHLVHNIVGTIVIVIAYIIFVVTIRRNYGAIASLVCDPGGIRKYEIKEMKMVLTVVTMFYICWLPSLAYNLWVTMLPEEDQNNKAIFINSIFLISCCNSLVNPFIYAGFNKLFRKKFVQIICFCCRSKHVDSQNSEKTSSQTASTPLPSPATIHQNPFQKEFITRL